MLLFSFVLLLLALLLTVGSWWLIQQQLPAKTATSTVQTGTTSARSDNTENTSVETESVAANALPLTEGQRSAAEAVGIDVDALVLTPAMIECARSKLSSERIEALIGGETPTFTETITLLPCAAAK